MFIAVLFMIVKGENNPVFSGQWVDKQSVVYTYRGIPLERKEMLAPAATWMKLEDIVLSEIIHHKKINIVQFYLHEVPRVGQIHRDKWNGSF